MRHLPSARAQSSAHRRTRRRRSRRGTVLLFALGVLAIISIAAVSYVTLVRVDRQSSSAVAKTVGYERQVGGVIDTIGGILAADLFGNKIVTTDVPADLNPRTPTSTPIWPRMFEDGEFRDYPFTNFATFNLNLPGKTPKNANVNWILKPDEAAPPDDAWLASLDPMWFQPGSVNDQTHWRQISNLRSAYTYDTNGTPNDFSDDRWIRGDGKFVDLGQLFLDYRTIGTEERGNPGTNLLDRTILGVNSVNGPVMPRAAAGNVTNAPFIPMNFASGDTGSPTLDPIDERFWADTDGDLRADARWQLIDSLGNREGLLWVTAARIVDLSAMVNVNSSVEGGYGAILPDDYAEGRTPADVDLYRLLLADPDEFAALTPTRVYNWNGAPHPRPSTTKLSDPSVSTFSDHLVNRLRVIELTNELSKPIGFNVLDTDFQLGSNWNWEEDTKRLKWHQRLALWNDVGSAPGRGPTISTPRGPVHPGYALSTMIDLHAFSGANNRSMVTDLEETIDGPDEAVGYLPRPEDLPNSPTGPLRSNTRPGDTRVFPGNPNGTDTKPSAAQLRIDPRRYLTTVSGVSDLSPVPVLNFKAVAVDNSRPYYSQFFNRKIRLGDFSLENVPDAFQAFVWALAPLATDEYLTPFNHARMGALVGDNINGKTINASPSFHYGGADSGSSPGPAENIGLTGGSASVSFGNQSGAAFATLTAAALAVNLKDASDGDADSTVARFFVAPAPPREKDPYVPLRSVVDGGTVLLGTRFSHGDIPLTPNDLLPTSAVGNRITDAVGLESALASADPAEKDAWMLNNANAGVTLVGAERTPYIGELFGIGAFESRNTPTINLADPAQQGGAMIVVQMLNPWSIEIDLSNYELVFMDPSLAPGSRLLDSPNNLHFRFPAGAKAENAVGRDPVATNFIFTYYAPTMSQYKDVFGRSFTDTDLPPLITNSIEWFLTQAGVVAGVKPADLPGNQLVPDAATLALIQANPAFVMLMRNGASAGNLTVVLRKVVPGLSQPAVVDVLETDDAFFDYSTVNLRDPDLEFDNNYFKAVGYVNVDTVGHPEKDAYDANLIGGRVMLTSSLTRPVRSSGGSSSGWFSYAAIQPRPEDSHVQNLTNVKEFYADAWLDPDIITTVTPIPASNLVDPLAAVPLSRPKVPVDFPKGMFLGRADVKLLAEGGFASRTAESGGWQLFIPDRPLQYVSELHQLCTYAHTCRNNDLNNLDAWATIGQQLRWSMDWTFTQGTTVADNPYLGTLDATRFLPTGNGGSMESQIVRDESLMLPLALRVFDCFEALDPAESLAQGRININTVPERVLQVLPLVAMPSTPDLGLGTPTLSDYNSRPKLVLQYRDAWEPDGVFGPDYAQYRAGLLLQLGSNIFNGGTTEGDFIRRHDQSHDPSRTGPNDQYPYTTGFATAGELAMLDGWGGNLKGQVDTNAFLTGFVAPLGMNGADDGASAIGSRVLEGEGDASVPADGIIDDPEERLALYRAVSNIVSSRSDVYGAWFILRGYDPKVIEAIEVTPGDEISSMLNSANPFTPAYESRWFVIFDRSNVRKPTDRPRVLLKAQLPSSRP